MTKIRKHSDSAKGGDHGAPGQKKLRHRNTLKLVGRRPGAGLAYNCPHLVAILKHRSDRRTLIWALLPPVVLGVYLVRPDLAAFLCLVSSCLALCCGVAAHNHNHCAIFHSHRANRAFSAWLSVFYGYPVFAWVPTHNQNHHRFNNRPGDETITWRRGNRHDWRRAFSYFFVSSWSQAGSIRAYIASARQGNPALYRTIVLQYAVWIGAHIALIAAAAYVHDAATGFRVWLFGLALPSLFSLWAIMFISFEQHVHTDAWSPRASSRNFTGRIINFMLLNNGYHTAHHERPGLHWSELPRAHAEIAESIPANLVEPNVLTYLVRQFVLAPWRPSYGTHQISAPPWEAPRSRVDEVNAL